MERRPFELSAEEAARIEDMLNGAIATAYWGNFTDRPDLMQTCHDLLGRIIEFQVGYNPDACPICKSTAVDDSAEWPVQPDGLPQFGCRSCGAVWGDPR